MSEFPVKFIFVGGAAPELELPDLCISERIIRKLNDTVQAQGLLPKNDISSQLSCAQELLSTLLEVKNILNGLNKKKLKNVSDILASVDIHLFLKWFFTLSYCYVFPEGCGEAAIKPTGKVNLRLVITSPPLYVAVVEILVCMAVSQTFASKLSSTNIPQLLLEDLNWLVLPSSISHRDQILMVLYNLLFLFEVSKSAATSALFSNVSDSVLTLINVFVSFEGPFETVTTRVKSFAIFIAAAVADDETSVYLAAEESCIDFIVYILGKSVRGREKYLNYQDVFAVDIANCVEKMCRFECLREALLGKGMVELLVTMVQIGDPDEDSAAASAMNALMQCYEKVNVPVLLKGLASDKDSASQGVGHTNVKEEQLDNGQNEKVTSLDKNNTQVISVVKFEASLKVQQESTETELQGIVNDCEKSKVNVEEREGLVKSQDGDYRVNVRLTNGSTDWNAKKPKSEVLKQNKEGTKGNSDKKTGVSGCGIEAVADAESTSKPTGNDEAREGKGATGAEKPKGLSQGSQESDQRKKEFVAETLKVKGNVQELEVKNAGNVLRLEKGGQQVWDSVKNLKTISTTDSKDRDEKAEETLPAQTSLGATSQSEAHKADTVSPEQEDFSSYLEEQIKSMADNTVKWIPVPKCFNPNLIKQPEPESTQPSFQRPFHYQHAGIDAVSGQDLHDIHSSLIKEGVHNIYNESYVNILDLFLKETKLREDGFFNILNCVPHVYRYKFLRTGSMERNLRVAPVHNKEGVPCLPLTKPVIHFQPEIDYLLVLKKFTFQIVPDHGSKMDFPGFTLIGPWLEKIPPDLEEWRFCLVPCQSQSAEGKVQYYLSADRLKGNFFNPMFVSFALMKINQWLTEAVGESLGMGSLKQQQAKIRKIEENDPAVTVYYFDNDLTVDYVLSVRHIQWPSCAAKWAFRERHWPNGDTVTNVISFGCHLVPKQPRTLSKEDPLYGLFFQYSFARAENILLNKLNEDNPVLTDCLRMLKFLCEMHFDRPQLLKSYHMQTIVLLAAERLPLSHWKADNFVKHLLDLLDDLLHFLVAQYLPNYFVPTQNLFQQFSHDFLIDVAKRVSKVRKDPIKYLTLSNSQPVGFYVF